MACYWQGRWFIIPEFLKKTKHETKQKNVLNCPRLDDAQSNATQEYTMVQILIFPLSCFIQLLNFADSELLPLPLLNEMQR